MDYAVGQVIDFGDGVFVERNTLDMKQVAGLGRVCTNQAKQLVIDFHYIYVFLEQKVVMNVCVYDGNVLCVNKGFLFGAVVAPGNEMNKPVVVVKFLFYSFP